jgi:hypothetical protein
MAFEGKPLAEVGESDLVGLKENAVAEGKLVDYKLEVGTNRDARKEFLKDASSFANTAGGHLLVGVAEGPPGVPADFPGLALESIDGEKGRLENMLRDGVSPRLRGVEMVAVPIGDKSRAVLVIHIPRSLSQPHVVDFDGHWRFYARNAVGAFPLDVEQLRTAFLAGETEAQRTRELRTVRLASLMAGELPVRLSSADMLVVHLVPASAWDTGRRVDASRLQRALERGLEPIRAGGSTHRPNIDGLLIHTPPDGEGRITAYLQLFASGVIETATSDPLTLEKGEGEKAGLWLPMGAFEWWLWESVPKYLRFQATDMEADFPVVLMVSLLGVEGARLMTKSPFYFLQGHPIDRPNLLFPEIAINDPATPKADYLRPVFDAAWNAGGYPGGTDIRPDGKLDLGSGYVPRD